MCPDCIKAPKYFGQNLIYEIIRQRYFSSEKQRGYNDPDLIDAINGDIICWAAVLCWHSVYQWAAGLFRKKDLTHMWYQGNLQTRPENFVIHS